MTAPLYKPNTDDDAPFMPWNDNAKPGPWGSPPSNETPPPRGPRRPAPPPEEQRSRWGERFGAWYRTPDGKPRLAAVATLIAAGIGLWLLSGLYIVQPGSVAVVTTFGAYDRQADPGLNYHLPWPIENAEAVPITLQRTDVGDTTPETENERLMLTSDGNIADVPFSVIWRVSDPRAYLFTLDDVDGAIKTVGESAVRNAVARTALQPMFSTAKDQVQAEAAAQVQQVFDSYHAGVHVDGVQIKSVAPPREAMDAYRELEAARQNAGPALDAAKAQATKVEQEAAANKIRTIQEAQADAARFAPVYAEYKVAPAVTRERLYVETMKRLLSRASKVVVTGKDASVTLPANPAKAAPSPAGGGA